MFLNRKSLKIKLLKIILPFFLILVTIFSIFIINLITSSIRSIINKNNTQMSMNLRNSMDYYLRNLDEIYIQLHLNYNIESFLNESLDITTLPDYLIAKANINSFLTNITITKPYIMDAFIANSKKDLIAQRGTLLLYEKGLYNNDKWYMSLTSSDDLINFYVTDIYNKNLSHPDKPVLLLTRKILNIRNKELLGILTICIDCQEIDKVFNANMIFPGQIFCITDKQNNLLYPPNIEEPIKSIIQSNRETTNVIRYHSEDSQLVFVSYIPEKHLYRDVSKVNNTFILFIIIFSVLLLLLTYYISDRITKPIMILADRMDDFRHGKNKHLPLSNTGGIYEMEKINSSFEDMVKRIEDLIDDIGIKNQEILKSEISVLQAQINPHFMYHTLNTIFWLSKVHKVNSITTIVSSLVNLLKLSVYKSEQFVTVEEEINYVKGYIQIENYRFTVPINLTINIEDGLEACQTLKLVLQPIVENCIVHGFEDGLDGNEISINCYTENEIMYFEVNDNGKGMDCFEIDNILAGKKKSGRFSGIGIRNVNDRLKLHFGDKYGLQINSQPGISTQVIIRQPVKGKVNIQDD